MVQLLAIMATFVPAVLWLWFFYTRDRYEREPKRLIGKLFLLSYAFVLVDLFSLGIYALLFRRALAASPFRSKQLAAQPPGDQGAPKPAG